MRKMKLILFFVPLFVFAPMLFAAPGMATTSKQATVSESDPYSVMQRISNDLLAGLKANKAELKKNKQIIYDLVHKIIMPHIDVNSMTQLVLGREGYADWKKASKAMQDQFITEFTDLVIGVYSSALESYENQKVEVYPPRGGIADKERVIVTSKIFTTGPPVHLRYVLRKVKENWKIIDFSVEGISLVQSYRSQFQPILEEGGLAKLLDTLKKHNETDTWVTK